MKTTLVIGALLVTCVMNAQTSQKPAEEKKQATVHIKKVENINGVERVTDTTYTTNDIDAIKIEDEMGGSVNGKQMKIITMKSDELKGDLTEEQRDQKIKELVAEMQKHNQEQTEKMSKEFETEKEKGNIKCISRTVIINVNMTDPNEAELKTINGTHGVGDGKLKVNDFKFFPNPSNGQSVNLCFELAEKGNAVVNVMDINGKSVFTDKLDSFSGKYNKTIDVSSNSKGVYFVKVEQNGHAQVKKLILD